jgi:uncharacterized protein
MAGEKGMKWPKDPRPLFSHTPTQRFGTLMLVLLFAALVGDLIFLPALLASPLGRLFRPREGGVPRTEIAPQAIEAAGDDLVPGAIPGEASGAEGNGEEPRSSRGSPSGVSSPPHLRPDPAHRPRARRSDER